MSRLNFRNSQYYANLVYGLRHSFGKVTGTAGQNGTMSQNVPPTDSGTERDTPL
jgi:hypothetical protein